MKGKILNVIFICIIILIIFTACRQVFFDEDIAITLFTSSKMTLETTIGPISFQNECFNSEDEYDLWFLPEKGEFDKGYIISNNDYNLNIWYYNGNNRDLSSKFSRNWDGQNEQPGFLLEPIKHNPGNLLFVKLSAPAYSTIIQYNETDNNLDALPNNIDLNDILFLNFGSIYGWSSAPTTKGAFVSPVDNRLYLSCYYYEYSPDSPEYRHYTFSYDIDPFSADHLINGESLYANEEPYINDPYINLEHELSSTYYFYFDIEKHRSIISTAEDGHFTTYYWDNELQKKEISKINSPITGLLHSSELYSDAGKKAVVYGIDGSTQYEFVKGGLKRLYEYYNGSKYITIFLYSYAHYDSDCKESEFYFDIYSIDSKDLPNLEN